MLISDICLIPKARNNGDKSPYSTRYSQLSELHGQEDCARSYPPIHARGCAKSSPCILARRAWHTLLRPGRETPSSGVGAMSLHRDKSRGSESNVPGESGSLPLPRQRCGQGGIQALPVKGATP